MLNMAFFYKSLLLTACVTLCCALPAQQFNKKANPAKSGDNSTKTGGTFGVDLSTAFSKSNFECLKGQGFDFAIIRAYQSTGQTDPNAKYNIENARAAGISNIDVYMFPCPKCGNPSGQVEDMVNALSGSGYGQIWLDIEGHQNWLGSQSENQNFFEELLSTAQTYVATGVYSSDSQWSAIMGSGYTGGSSAQLWYSSWNGNPSFSDFSQFGGWTQPAIKQYKGNVFVCGVSIDEDWYM